MTTNKPNLKFSILITTYNAEDIVEETLKSILSQSYSNFEVIISDDRSTDKTVSVVKKIQDKRIVIYQNDHNLGYPGNMEVGRQKCRGDILYLMGQDDILGEGALQNTYNAFKISPNIGAVTRPYFWFSSNVCVPVRAKKQLNPNKNEVVSIFDEKERVIRVIDTLDQLSGLAFRTKFIDRPFHQDIFPCHIYPFLSIFKEHPVVFLKDYNLAVRIGHSQARHVSSIYDKSPLLSWVQLAKTVLHEKKYHPIRNYLINDFIARNYVGLVQIKNFARFRYLLREIYYLIKFRPLNLLEPLFWFFSLGTIITPASILIPMVDKYKDTIYTLKLRDIKFSYSPK